VKELKEERFRYFQEFETREVFPTPLDMRCLHKLLPHPTDI